MERDPNKRKVKPVEKHLELMTLAADYDDSEDDSDYNPVNQPDDDDDDIESSADDEDEDDEDDDDDEEDEKHVESKPKSVDLLSFPGNRGPVRGTCSTRILVCSVCLGDISRSDDEIVECDSCGISVHEACYGIVADDTESVHSNTSSASTEPWFCDPCKANVKNPVRHLIY